MLALARFRLPDGSVETLCAGDIVGRIWSAALRIDDPDISEAHALLSLRGEGLWLLALSFAAGLALGGALVPGPAEPVAGGATLAVPSNHAVDFRKARRL